MIKLIATLIAFVALLNGCNGSHYKGGTVSVNWKSTSVVNLAYESYYRRNPPSPNVQCTQQLIQSQSLLTDSVNIYYYLCRNGSTSCSQLSYISHTFTCKNYDEKEDWSIVERNQDIDLSRYTINSGDSVVFRLSNSAWVNLFDKSYDYNWASYNRLFITDETNQKFNTAPTIKTFPHRNMICGCESTFQMLPYDADNDVIRCRLSKYSGYKNFAECGYCISPTTPLVRLDEKTCTLYFSADLRVNVIVEVQIEDFDNETSTEPKSSTTLQFSTKMDKSKCPASNQPQDPSICTTYPVFTQEVPPYGSCYAVELPYKSIIEAMSSSQNISAINVNAFQGFVLESPLTYNKEKKSWFYNYSIQSNDTITVRQESIVLEAIDSSGLASPQHTYNYLLNFVPPKITSIDNLGPICYQDLSGSNSINLTIHFNRLVVKPDNSNARILFVNVPGNDVVYSITTSKLTETLPFQSLSLSLAKSNFKVSKSYAVLFEFGAFVVDEYCKPQTDRITDTERFKFNLIADTAEIVFSTKRNEIVNGNSSIKWTMNHGRVENCFIRAQEETSYQIFDCSDKHEFPLKNFNSSSYSFYFTYISQCLHQVKYSETLNFRLVNQKPILTYSLTNYNGVYASKSSSLKVACSHPITCNLKCRLYQSNASSEDVQFSSCQSSPFTTIQDGLSYIYEIHASDSVNNTADSNEIRFKADIVAPTLVNPPIAAHQGQCGDDLTRIPTPKIQDNFDPAPQISYTDRKTTSACTIQRAWLANDHVNNSANFNQNIVLTQQSTITAPSSFNLSCIDNNQVLKDIAFYNGFITIGNNLCNATLRSTFTYSPSLPARDCDFTLQLVWKLTDDCSTTYADIRQTVFVEAREIPYSPLHLQQNVELSPYFKWAVLKDSSSYRVTLRRDADESSREIGAALKTNQLKLSYKLEQNTTYYWNVEYFNANQQLIKLSPSFEFKTKLMSDLSIVDVKVPLDTFPAEDILVSWTVKNIGRVTTSGSQWYDSVYGSEVNDFAQSRYLGRVAQRRFLEPNGQYDAQFKFKLDERVKFSAYYVFLVVDRENVLDDFNLANNQLESPKLIQVKPIPLPNLEATKILAEEFAKAGQTFVIEWQVNNIGEGSVKLTDKWTDFVEIFIVDKTSFRSILKTTMIVEKRELSPNAGYLMRAQVFLPQKHFGDANIELTVNKYDTLYETSLENNKISTFITILPPDTPDLSLIEFELSDTSFLTGQILRVNYSVENEGSLDLESSSWNDEVKIINELNKQVIVSQIFRNLRSLSRKSSYSNQIEIKLDNRISTGPYEVSIRIDSSNAIFCPFPSGIKTEVKEVYIQRSLPTWSLKSHSIQVSQAINVNKTRQINTISLAYEVTIELPTELSESLFWTDSYFLSDRSKFESKTATRLEESSQRVSPQNGQLEYSVRVNKSFEMFDPPESETERQSLYGTLYVYTFVDESEINEKLLQFDFPISKRITLTKIIPKINLTRFDVDSNYELVDSSYQVPLTFSVRNLGPLALLSKPKFGIYLQTGQSSVTTRIKQVQLDEYVLVDQEAEMTTIVEISKSYYGKLILSIRSEDPFSFEFITTVLQTSKNNTITIEQPSSVDFATTSLEFNTKIESYSNKSGACNQNLLVVDVNYSVENIGLSMSDVGTWNDKIEIYCGSGSSSLKYTERVIPISRQLRTKQNYSQSAQFLFDSTSQGFTNCRVDLRANYDGRMFEFDTQNNKKSSCCFDIPKRAEAILEAEITSPVQSGTPISLNSTGFLSVRYVYKNRGNGTSTFVTSWTDNFYLFNQSSATIDEITKNGVLIGSKKQSNLVVDCNSVSDSNIINMQIPFRVVGRWFGYLLDINSLKLQSTSRLSSELEFDIIKTEACDLEVANATLISTTSDSSNLVSGGDTISFSFDVFNVGAGDARGMWFDTVYLARFPAIGPLDIKLLSEARPVELTPNSAYTSTFELRLPLTLKSGTYFIVFVTDSLRVTNDLELNNNQNYIQIEVEEKPPVDVYLQDVKISIIDDSKAINFNWSFSASDEVNAMRCDQYYLQPSDFFIKTIEIASGFCERFEIKRIGTGVFQSINVKNKVEIPMVIEGEYSGTVKTISNLPETNFENNIGVSNETISILVEELKLNENHETIIDLNSNKLYKFIPNYSMNGFRVVLSTDSTSAFNDIFIGDDKQVPNENTFRARSKIPFSFNQTASIKNVKPNVYYILIKSFSGSSAQQNYSITLRVQEIKEIDVELIYPSQFSNLGRNTFRFTGLFIAKKFEVCLLKSTQTEKRLCSWHIYSFSEELLYATFEPIKGLFNPEDLVELEINGIRIANKTISVIEGSLGKIQAKLNIERTVYTPNQTVIAKLAVTNLGDTDVFTPLGLLSTVDLATASTVNDIDSIESPYRIVKINDHPYPSYPLDNLIAFNENGLGGVIQPRSTIYVRFEIRPQSADVLGAYKLYFHMFDDDNFLYRFLQEKIDIYKPNAMSPKSWSVLSNALLEKAFWPTVQNDLLHRTVNHLSAHNIKVYRLDELIAYHINRIDGAFEEDLLQVNDISIVPDRLSLVRTYPSRYSLRSSESTNGAFCLGWQDNLHISASIDTLFGVLRLTISGVEKILYESDDEEGFYDSSKYEATTSNLASNGLIEITSKLYEITYFYNVKEACLRRIEMSASDGSPVVLHVTCNSRNKRISEITSNDESISVRFSYSQSNCLTSVNKYLKDDGGRVELVVYTYDSQKRLVSATGPGFTHAMSYDTFNNLKEITETDRLTYSFRFSAENGVQLVNMMRFDETSKTLVLDYSFNRRDDGFLVIRDNIRNVLTTKLYDLIGRNVYMNQNDVKSVKLTSSAGNTQRGFLENGEVQELKRFDYAFNRMRISNVQDEQIVYKQVEQVEENDSIIKVEEYTDPNGNVLKKRKTINIISGEVTEVFEHPNGQTESRTIDGQQMTIMNRNGAELRFTYDALRRRRSFSYDDEDSSNIRECKYEYRGDSTRIVMAAAGSTGDDERLVDSVFVDYDNDLKVSQTRMMRDGAFISYIYDDTTGLLSEVKTSFGQHVKYEYNDKKQISRVVDQSNMKEVFSIKYDDIDNTIDIFSTQEATLLQARIDRDISRVVGLTTNSTSRKSVVSYEYEYNNKLFNTEIKKKTDNGVYVQKYYFDSLGRTLAIQDSESETDLELIYDSNGNRRQLIKTQSTRSGKVQEKTDYVLNNMNQIVETNDAKFTYDAAGNVIKRTPKSSNQKEATFDYYDDGKLKRAVNVNNDNCTYTYDCMDRLSVMNCSQAGVFTYYYHYNQVFGGYVLAAIKYPNGTIVNFIYVPYTTITVISSGSTHVYLPLIDTTNSILTPTQERPPTVIEGLELPIVVEPETGLPTPVINRDPAIVLDQQNNKPFSFDLDIYSPVDLFDTTSYTSNLYQGLSTNNFNQQIDIFSESMLNLAGISQPNVASILDHIYSPFTVPDLNFPSPTSGVSKAKSSFDKFVSSYVDPICNTLDYRPKPKPKSKPKSVISTTCKAATAFLHSLIKGDGLIQAGLSFGAELPIPYFGDAHNTMNVLCNFNSQGAASIFGSYTSQAITNHFGITDLADQFGPYGKGFSCAVGALEYLAGGLLSDALEALANWALSLDPNDIIGPEPYGAQDYIWNKEPFVFKIRFENVENASAPAQLVKVSFKIYDHFDLRSIRLISFGFNQFSRVFDESSRSSYFSDTVEYGSELPSFVQDRYEIRVFGTVDMNKREIIWQFKTIDLTTGDLPDDASVGLLPPKTDDFGEGYVEFQIDLARTAVHMSELTADAVIIFDNNEPIYTNELHYTIDSEAPKLSIEWLARDKLLLVRASDSGSGVGLVSIIDQETQEVLSSSSEAAEFVLTLEPRSTPYEIYASVQDNVGNLNPLKYYLSVNVSDELPTSCPNNCSGNGVCNSKFVCVCFDNYTEEDCSRNLTLAEILSEPVGFRFGYKASEIRDRFDFELELDDSFEIAFIEIVNFPVELEVIESRQNRINHTFTSDDTEFDFKVKVPLNYLNSFELELIISAERTVFDENDQENVTVVVENRHKLPIMLYSFMPEIKLELVNETDICLETDSGLTSTKLTFIIDQLNSFDNVNIDQTVIYNTFISIDGFERINESTFEVELSSSEESFEPVNVHFQFEVTYTSNNDTIMLSKDFVFRTCGSETDSTTKQSITTDLDLTTSEDEESTSTTTKKPGLSGWAIGGIVVGAIVAVIVVIVLIICCCKMCA